MKTSTLRPGLLVALKTSVRGNVTYDKRIVESEHLTDAGSKKASWQTTRVIADPAEQERAEKVRSDAAGLVRKVCTHTAFGHLCPEIDKDKLDAAIRDARQMAEEFNATAELSRVSVYIMVGRIAADDVEAVKAINSEVEYLMRAMQEGLQDLDVKKVREAAAKAREIGQMLSPDAQARVTVAVEAAREVAKRMVKAGEQAAAEVDLATIRRIDEQRLAFLDIDTESVAVAAPAAQGRAVDFDPSVDAAPSSVVVEQRQLEL